MSTLIIYMSKHSTTEKVSEMIKRGLVAESVNVVNLGKSKAPDLASYNSIIIGGSIHMGLIQKKIKNFCTKNKEQLLTKKLGLFICYMEVEKGVEEFETNFPIELREHAIAKGLLGGEFIIEKMNFFERMIVKKISKISTSVNKLKTREITEFINKMNQ